MFSQLSSITSKSDDSVIRLGFSMIGYRNKFGTAWQIGHTTLLGTIADVIMVSPPSKATAHFDLNHHCCLYKCRPPCPQRSGY